MQAMGAELSRQLLFIKKLFTLVFFGSHGEHHLVDLCKFVFRDFPHLLVANFCVNRVE